MKKKLIKGKTFQAVTFYDDAQKKQVVVLYCLGEDGILREFTGGKWHPYAIEEK
jgi:hypothetical protein